MYSLFLILTFDRKDILETFVVVKNGGEDRGVCVVAGQKRDEDAEKGTAELRRLQQFKGRGKVGSICPFAYRLTWVKVLFCPYVDACVSLLRWVCFGSIFLSCLFRCCVCVCVCVVCVCVVCVCVAVDIVCFILICCCC